MGAQGIWNKVNGILLGRPGGNCSEEEIIAYEEEIKYIIGDEYGRNDIPILSRMDFGHTDPIMVLPYGVKAEIDADKRLFSIVESGVI